MDTRQQILDQILSLGPVMPVLVIDEVADAVPLARTLVDNGVRVLEVTLRTTNALSVIACLSEAVPEAVIGAGTVTTPEQLAAVERAGARFAVSPGLGPRLLAAARDAGLPLLPGVMTTSEAMSAAEAGFTRLKLFPAQQAGGVGMLKALHGPLPDLRFCPTGGIGVENAPEYLALPNVLCVGGSWLAPDALVRARDWDEIGRRARHAASLRSR